METAVQWGKVALYFGMGFCCRINCFYKGVRWNVRACATGKLFIYCRNVIKI